jgi:hypothetical protein
MNTQPTPETDAAELGFSHKVVPSDFARKLERQRNEARADTICWMSIAEGRGRTDDDDTGKAMSNLIRQRDETRKELSKWRILNGWGGTPEIIHDFIKGQQTRIHHAQDLEEELATVTEQRDRLAEAVRLIADGTSCRECGGEDQALFARQALQSMICDALQSLTQKP